MAGERLPIQRLTTVITPATEVKHAPHLPYGDKFVIFRQTAGEQGYPTSGQNILIDEAATLHVPLSDGATETQVFGALKGVQHLDIFQPFQHHLISVLSDQALAI